MAAVKRKNSESEHEKVANGLGDITRFGITPSDFIIGGLDIEEQQQVSECVSVYRGSPPLDIRQLLIVDVRHDTAGSIQALHVQKRRMALLIQIRKFKEAQLVFMPGLHSYLTTLGPEIDLTSRPEEISLHMPSSIPMIHRQSVCSPGLPDIEDQLRYAQAVEALAGLHRQLRAQIMASKLNRQDMPSQRNYLRSRALQDQVELRV